MKVFLILLAAVCVTAVLCCGAPSAVRAPSNETAGSETAASCSQFETLVKNTYTFKPSKLSEAEKNEKGEAMDRVWKYAESNREQAVPCLWSLLKAPNADPFFRFDGSNLLVSLDPSREAKQLQVDIYATAPLEDVDLRFWVSGIAQRGEEGFDASKAGLHWLDFRQGRYFLPEHGGYEINHERAALIVFGSMDEAFATPSLLGVASNRQHPAREKAVRILMSQATVESLQALKRLDSSGLSAGTSSQLRNLLAQPQLFVPRDKPKTTREEFVSAFEKLVAGNSESFFRLVAEVPDGERDVVAVLRPEDLPLVRKVRRRMIRNANQHAIEYYDSFTLILLTMIWKPEIVR